jgi:hypothetical protein
MFYVHDCCPCVYILYDLMCLNIHRNYSADSILESLDGDAPAMLRNPKGNAGSNHTGRSSLQYSLGGSMSQLPSNSTAPQPRQRPSSQGVNYQHWLVQVII